MKCQILFSRINKKNIISLSSAESAHSLVSVEVPITTAAATISFFFLFFFYFSKKITLDISHECH